ncbi:MAG TPA: hypothetical protein DCL54_03855, partial [Alphaproteobacteria bacterium]|nr:hypothetical protein [Alphaproteobacteria bacterium]
LVGSVRPDYKFDFSLSTGERVKGTTSVRSLFDRQRDMIESERRTVGGSPTAGAADAIANQGGDQRRLAGALDMLRAPQEIPWKIAAAVAERITQPMIYNPAVSRELGELLATRGKDRLLAVIDEIRQRQAATGRGPKPPTPTIPPPSTPIRAGGFAGFGGRKPSPAPPPAAPSRRARNDRFETLRLLVQRQNPGVADDQIDALTEQEYRAFYGRPAPGVKVTEKDYADGWERAVNEAKDHLDATAGPGNYTAADLEREAIEGFTGVYSGRGLPEDTMALPLTLAKDGERALPGKRIYVFEVNGKAFTGATPEEAARRAGDLSPAMGNVSENKPTVRKYAIEEDGTQVPYDEAIRSRPKAPPASPESEFARLVTAEQRLNAPARELTEGDLLRLAEPYARAYAAKGGKGASDIERAAYEVVQRMGGSTKSSGLSGLRTDLGAGVGGALFSGAMPMEEDATLEDKLARAATGFALGFGASKAGRVGARMLAEAKAASPILTAGLGGGGPRKPMPKAVPMDLPPNLRNARMGSSWKEPDNTAPASAVAARVAQKIAKTRPDLSIGRAVSAPGRKVAAGLRALDRRLRSPEDPRLLQPSIAPGEMRAPASGTVPTTRPAIERMKNPGAAADVLAGVQRRAEKAYGKEKADGIVLGRSERALQTLNRIEGYMQSLRSRLNDLRAQSPTDEGLAIAIEARKTASARYMSGMEELARLISKGAPSGQIAKVQQDVDTLRASMKTLLDKPKKAPGLAKLEAIDVELRRALLETEDAGSLFGPSGRQIRQDNEIADLLTNPARAQDALRASQAKPLGSHELKGHGLFWGGAAAAAYGLKTTADKERDWKTKDQTERQLQFQYKNKHLDYVQGEELAQIQRYLNEVVPLEDGEKALTDDGKFGAPGKSNTSARIRRYQKMRGLTVTGSMTAETREQLRAEISALTE